MTILLAAILIALFGALGIAKLAAVPAMRTAAEHLRFSVTQYRVLGALEIAGAAGIAIGVSLPLIGVTAAVGLVLLMLGAAGAHLTRSDGPARIAVPLLVAGIALAYLLTVVLSAVERTVASDDGHQFVHSAAFVAAGERPQESEGAGALLEFGVPL